MNFERLVNAAMLPQIRAESACGRSCGGSSPEEIAKLRARIFVWIVQGEDPATGSAAALSRVSVEASQHDEPLEIHQGVKWDAPQRST